MLQAKVLNVENKQIEGKDFYKTLIMINYEGSTILCEKYLQNKKEINKTYEVLLDRTDNLKYLNVKLGNEILVADSDKKGIFNK